MKSYRVEQTTEVVISGYKPWVADALLDEFRAICELDGQEEGFCSLHVYTDDEQAPQTCVTAVCPESLRGEKCGKLLVDFASSLEAEHMG